MENFNTDLHFITFWKDDIRKFGSIEETIENGYFYYWNKAKIARAFNLGNGNNNDMMLFIRSNIKNGLIAIELTTEKVYNIVATVDFTRVKNEINRWQFDKYGFPVKKI